MNLLSDFLNDRIENKFFPVGQTKQVRYFPTDNSDTKSFSDDEYSDNSLHNGGTDYAKEYVEEEMVRYAECGKYDMSQSGGMTDVDDALSTMSGLDMDELTKMAHYPEIYTSYNFEATLARKELPIDAFKSKVINMINTNSVVVIHGPTGCGKTTQVPQYILDECRSTNKYCNIVVTQPRRIATITVCRRVCEERGWSLGTICGYQIGLEKKLSNDTILSFVTTGVLLQKLITNKTLNQYTHIIIDEVHERTQDLDFLLLVVRKFLFTHSPHTKVVLMSATIDAEELAYYFRTHSGTKAIAAPIIHIDKENEFTKHIFYANHLNKLQPLPSMDFANPEISQESYKLLRLLIGAFDNLDVADPTTGVTAVGSVLVFLPGINEIEEAQKYLLSGVNPDKKIKWHLIPLHSSLPNDEQAKAFFKPKPNGRKIILSTNLAESSITVPDIQYVIDFCLTKVMTQDPETKFMSLVLEWASHVNCEQRAGRAGRVANGRVYRLVDRDFYEYQMKKKSLPEILRAPLDRVVLQAKRLNFSEPPKAILALALDPPDINNIEATIWSLKECGGLLTTCRGIMTLSDGDITFLGTVMASLPLEVRLTKLIVLGQIFNCLKECIIIAAGCSIQNIFKTPFQRRHEAYKRRLVWADESCSDLIALLNLYNVWQSYRRQNKFSNAFSEKLWCDTNFVSLKGLHEWNCLVTEISMRLKTLRIEETVGPQKPLLDKERSIFLKVIMCGAFYPNYFTRSVNNGKIDEKEAVKTIGGRDPFRTVYLTGFSIGQPGPLYVKQIKNLVQSRGDMETKISVGFDGSSKIYIEFPNYKVPETVNIDGQQVITTLPGKISQYVYEAVKKRLLKIPFDIKVLPNSKAWEFAESLKEAQKQKITQKKLSTSATNSYDINSILGSVIPSLDTQYIKIVITWKVDPGHFWCQNLSNDTVYVLSQIEKQLNNFPLKQVGKIGDVVVGEMYASKFHDDNRMYRCKVTIIDPKKTIYVLFCDYGNMQVVRAEDLYHLPNHVECYVPPLAMECVLSNIQPKISLTSPTIWNKRIHTIFDKETHGVSLYGKVYSVVDDVVHLELFKSLSSTSGGPNSQMSLNKFLIDQGYAEYAEESYLSQEDFKRRDAVSSSVNLPKEFDCYNSQRDDLGDLEYLDIEERSFTKTLRLKGPYSPLEMKVYGIIKSAHDKICDIEANSVNAVLLDDDPQNPHTRLLVAAYVGQGVSGNLRLRQTALMPKITGFPMLMTLLFCPHMEPKPTKDGTRVAAILCGLGCNEKANNKPYYAVHDLRLTLDTELTVPILEEVNRLRYFMNRSMQLMETVYEEGGSPNELISLQNDVKKQLWNILNLNLKSAPPIEINYSDVWGRALYRTRLLVSKSQNDCDIWPMLSFIKLNDLSTADMSIKENLSNLHEMAERLIPEEPVRCELCTKDLLSLGQIRFHLISQSHKANAVKFQEKFEDSDSDDESS